MRSLIIFFSVLFIQQLYGQQLTVKISSIPSNEGQIIVELFQGEDNFLEKSYKRKVISISGVSAKVVFENLPAGEYALGVIHDENKNGELDTFMKIPREPIAISNNATPEFGPPSYDDAKFSISAGKNVIQRIHFTD